MPTSQAPQQQIPASNGSQDFSIGIDGNTSMGMGLDLGIPLDDIFGNAASRTAGPLATDDWVHWMV